MSRRKNILKWMLLLPVLLSAALLPMQGQKQGSDYVLHIRHLDALQAAGKIDDVSKTSRAARREVMREQGIPTSQQPESQSKNASGREYRYEVPLEYGKKKEKSEQQQTLDCSHENSPHWEAAGVKVDKRTGETQMNPYGRPKLRSNKSKRYYEPE